MTSNAPSSPSLYESFALYGSGVTLIAVRDKEQDRFLVAASVLTASVSPFTLAVSIGRDRDALPAIAGGAPWTVAVLGEHHASLVRHLTAGTTRDERLAALIDGGAQPSREGPLWLPDALVTFWCRTQSTAIVNDQVLVVGLVERGSGHGGGRPLMRWHREFVSVTHLADDVPHR